MKRIMIDEFNHYEDDELIKELEERGYGVYKGKEMQKCITQLEGLQDGLINKSEKLKEGDKNGI